MIKMWHGDPLMVDHTPGAAVAAGEGVNINGEIHIAHRDIEANRLGALAAPSGKAVYKVPLGTGESFAAGADVPFDFTAQEAQALGTATVGLTCVLAADQSNGDAYVVCRHGD